MGAWICGKVVYHAAGSLVDSQKYAGFSLDIRVLTLFPLGNEAASFGSLLLSLSQAYAVSGGHVRSEPILADRKTPCHTSIWNHTGSSITIHCTEIFLELKGTGMISNKFILQIILGGFQWPPKDHRTL